MKIWIDAQLPPALAPWMRETFSIDSQSARELHYLRATDIEIFRAPPHAGATVMTKDGDFIRLVEQLGTPPQILWITCGNTSNVRLREILMRHWPKACALLASGEPIVEIGEPIRQNGS